jgi:hypothetical protein
VAFEAVPSWIVFARDLTLLVLLAVLVFPTGRERGQPRN